MGKGQGPTQREIRRKKENEARKILSAEQYAGLKASVIDNAVHEKVDKIMVRLSGHMITALKANHIGKDRVAKIASDIRDLCLADQRGGAND